MVYHTNPAKHRFDFDAKKIMKKVRSKTKVKIHEADQIILHEHQAVNFKSDAEYGILQSDPKKVRNVVL